MKLGLGTILILFILLVIVTSFFCKTDDDVNPPIETADINFYIVNETINYKLRFSSRTGPANLPRPSGLDPGNTAEYVIRTSGILSPVSVTTRYTITDMSNQRVGSFEFLIQTNGVRTFFDVNSLMLPQQCSGFIGDNRIGIRETR